MIEYLETTPAPDDHLAFLRLAHEGWDDDQRRRVIKAFAHSDWAAGAYQDGELVGTIRLVTDRVGFALIADLLVRPDCRRQGIATALLKMADVACPDLYLYADPQNEIASALYKKIGWQETALWRRSPR